VLERVQEDIVYGCSKKIEEALHVISKGGNVFASLRPTHKSSETGSRENSPLKAEEMKPP